MDLSVAEAAARLGVDRSRVEQLLRAGRLAGRRSGRIWLVDASSLANLERHPRPPGRPMAPARAWGLLDLLDGGGAPWLPAVGRSQVRSRIRGLVDAGADEWRALLRARSDVHGVLVHPAALRQLPQADGVLVAGARRAAELGADLVVLDEVVEVYVEAGQWPHVAEQWHARDSADGNLVVRVPRGVWPFPGDEVGAAALAADLLESVEPRAVSAGLDILRAHARAVA